MTDFFITAAGSEADDVAWQAPGHMLGSIDWDEVALLSRLLGEPEYDYDDVEWEEPRGDTQLGLVPAPLAGALVALRDDQVNPLAEAWHALLCAECGWDEGEAHTLAQDIDGLRVEARRAAQRGGALWLRIEP